MHPDNLLLVALIDAHDRADGNTPGSDGKVAGVDSFALLGAAGTRAQQMLEGHGNLQKTLGSKQQQELLQLMAAMWRDGFAVGVRSRKTAA